jgi:hypothetical protein
MKNNGRGKRLRTESGMEDEDILLFFLVEYQGHMKIDRMVLKKGTRKGTRLSKKKSQIKIMAGNSIRSTESKNRP